VYDRFEFDVPTGPSPVAGEAGDCFARHWIRVREVEESVKIIRQALAQMPEGPVLGRVTKGFKPPVGEVYVRGENPRGELAVYMIASGKDKAYRVRCRGPSFSNIAVITEVARGVLLADLVALIGSLDIVLGEVDR
jgi:NADH-quinone oxidoreductase subunit D